MQFKLFVDPGAIGAGGVCTFRIAGGKPGAKGSWEVKGVRNDRFVRTYGCAVETEKSGPNAANTSTRNSTAYPRRWA